MYNYTIMRLFVCLAALFTLTVGCAKAPEDQVTTTRSALDSAMTAEAEKYAPEKFQAAKDSLEVAMAEIEKQNSKFSLMRKYGKSEQQLQSAESIARSAAQAAAANKAQIKLEAEDMMSQLQTAITESKALIEKAPRGKEGVAAIESIKSDVAAIEMTLTDISTALGNEDFIGAREMARAGLEKIQAINGELNQAIEKKQMIKKSM
ncbi:MAG: hypothetical protein ABIA59_03730 [Candidatus Latescibacterota bacterium]